MPPPGPEDGGRALDDVGDPPLDRWLDLLAHRDRRLVISALADSGDERLPAAVLADAVAREHPADVDTQSVLIDLHHVQLPKLQRAGVVEYDPDASLVTYRADPRLEQCLRAVQGVAAD